MDKNKIPKGMYCYDDQKLCPYWGKDYSKLHQENGYCSLLGVNDWQEEGDFLLWDMVKLCGINEE